MGADFLPFEFWTGRDSSNLNQKIDITNNLNLLAPTRVHKSKRLTAATDDPYLYCPVQSKLRIGNGPNIQI